MRKKKTKNFVKSHSSSSPLFLVLKIILYKISKFLFVKISQIVFLKNFADDFLISVNS